MTPYESCLVEAIKTLFTHRVEFCPPNKIITKFFHHEKTTQKDREQVRQKAARLMKRAGQEKRPLTYNEWMNLQKYLKEPNPWERTCYTQ